MDRRRILKYAVQGTGLLAGAVIVIPSVISALSPALGGRRAASWRRLGRLEEFPVGAVSEAVVGDGDHATGVGVAAWAPSPRQAVYVWRPEARRVVVFSRACTDLGCPVNYDPGSQCYLCPCHGGIFNSDGERMAGPPDRPLYRFDVRVRKAVVEIDLSSAPIVV